MRTSRRIADLTASTGCFLLAGEQGNAKIICDMTELSTLSDFLVLDMEGHS